MRTVYISCHHRDPANALAAQLRAAGIEVVSTWHTGEAARPAPDNAEAWGEKAAANLRRIDNADDLVLVASPEHLAGTHRVPGGKFVEAGFAIAIAFLTGDMRVFTVGGVENGMLWHPVVKHAKNADDLIAQLRSRP
jgi:hypothetical protein